MTEEIPTLTPRMKRTISRAGELAQARGHDYLGTEHLILALIEDPNGIAGGVIERLGCAAAIRDEVVRIIESDGYSRGSPARSSRPGRVTNRARIQKIGRRLKGQEQIDGHE